MSILSILLFSLLFKIDNEYIYAIVMTSKNILSFLYNFIKLLIIDKLN